MASSTHDNPASSGWSLGKWWSSLRGKNANSDLPDDDDDKNFDVTAHRVSLSKNVFQLSRKHEEQMPTTGTFVVLDPAYLNVLSPEWTQEFYQPLLESGFGSRTATDLINLCRNLSLEGDDLVLMGYVLRLLDTQKIADCHSLNHAQAPKLLLAFPVSFNLATSTTSSDRLQAPGTDSSDVSQGREALKIQIASFDRRLYIPMPESLLNTLPQDFLLQRFADAFSQRQRELEADSQSVTSAISPGTVGRLLPGLCAPGQLGWATEEDENLGCLVMINYHVKLPNLKTTPPTSPSEIEKNKKPWRLSQHHLVFPEWHDPIGFSVIEITPRTLCPPPLSKVVFHQESEFKRRRIENSTRNFIVEAPFVCFLPDSTQKEEESVVV